mgnify:FL=1
MSIAVLRPSVEAFVDPETSILEGTSAEVAVLNPTTDYVYTWQNDNDNSNSTGAEWEVFPSETTEYTVTATLAHCTASSSVIVEVDKLLIIPNAFTPNGDGINDVWNIEGIEDYSDLRIQIFNRWGSPVYQIYGEYEVWGGTSKSGKLLPVATYYYVIEMNDENKTVYRGDVSILQ